jgi:mRNA-degrading endonuclease toxin of MazEF toxin-antitoxin module
MPRLQQASPLDARCGEVGYVPKRGDLIWLAFQPQADHEQSGRRPALLDQSPQGATRIIAHHKAHKMSRRATGFMVS